jgi:hypothetical protein
MTCMQTKMQIGSTQQLARASVRSPFTAAPLRLARGRQAVTVRAEDTRDRGAQKLDSDSYQSAHTCLLRIIYSRLTAFRHFEC